METATLALPLRHRQPIERKPFYHFRPGAGTLTLAAPGCSFRCDYCQNASVAQVAPDAAGLKLAWPDDLAAIAETAAREAMVLALSFTEPVLAAEATLALHRHAAGRVPIVWKTNGFITGAALAVVAPALAAVNIDLKAADEDTHVRLTQAPLGPVLAAMRGFAAAGVWVEISTTLIPGVNDDPKALATLAGLVAGLGAGTPWHLRRFHPDHRRQDSVPTSPESLARAVGIAGQAGLRHVYVERALGAAGATTFCAGCGAAVVTRQLGRLQENRLQNGHCPACMTPPPGRW